MLYVYRSKFPQMLSSRREFLLFTFRAHNAVNARLLKPVQHTVAECMALLRNNMRTTPASTYRIAYLNHIRRYWRTLQDVSGMTALKKIVEMMKIETDYSTSRNNNFEEDIAEGMVVLPNTVLVKPGEEPHVQRPRPTGRGMVMTSGGLRFRR